MEAGLAKLNEKTRALTADVGRKEELIKELRAKMLPVCLNLARASPAPAPALPAASAFKKQGLESPCCGTAAHVGATAVCRSLCRLVCSGARGAWRLLTPRHGLCALALPVAQVDKLQQALEAKDEQVMPPALCLRASA
jgi:hypothetical protein